MSGGVQTVAAGNVVFVVHSLRAWMFEAPPIDGNREFKPRTCVFVNDLPYPINIPGDHRETLRDAVEAHAEAQRALFEVRP